MTERKPRVEKAFQQFDPDGFGVLVGKKRSVLEDQRTENSSGF